VKLFVNRGSRGGLSEDDLTWALREGAVLPDEAIHSVRVLDRFSFLEVSADQAERAVEYLDGTKLKGRQIRMEIARS
jgi:ATP-dependent RNA helicase DeaD